MDQEKCVPTGSGAASGRNRAGLGMDWGKDRSPGPPGPAQTCRGATPPLPLMLRQRIGHRRVG